MAQSKVTSFFSARKRNAGIQPSKRLKIQQDVAADLLNDTQYEGKAEIVPTQCVLRKSKKECRQPETTSTTNSAGSKSISKSTSRSERRGVSAKSQPTITASLRSTRSSSRSSSPVSCASNVPESEVKKSVQDVAEFSDVATAACDDHTVSPPCSPSKRTSSKNITAGGKRSKHVKCVRKDLLSEIQPQEQGATRKYDFSKFLPKEGLEKEVVRKRLVMKRRNAEHLNEKRTESEDEPQELQPSAKANQKRAVVEQNAEKSKLSEPFPRENKTKEALDPVAVRAHLAKSGKLAELQERLSQFSKAAAKVKEDKKVKRLADLKSEKEKANEAAKPKTVPAFERYHSLAEPVPPGLTLPYKYKLLLDMYHAVDTVVSMLHKRAEVCTFSKLKNAVQVMTRKAFEQKNLAQIKSIFPDGFTVRQEKGLPIPGTGNLSNWQLTIEANLHNSAGEKDNPCDKDGRPMFTATRLLERKSLFHRLLIDIVKGHHKEFLANMDRPLTVPDDKVTRWHPRFRVDQVPEIIPTQLPQPPDIKKFTTAVQVLEESRTKNQELNARVKKALENVAKQKAADEARAAAKRITEKTVVKEPRPSTEMKGIPQGLLERIRAKEAEKTVRSMMLTPADEKRKEQISRLPDIVRIIRTFFVVYKKPCLPIEEAIKKVSVSAKSSMGTVEAEAHIKLLLELVPEWVSMITVRKGRYLKIDRNQDLTAVISKLNAAEKQ